MLIEPVEYRVYALYDSHELVPIVASGDGGYGIGR